MKQQADVENKIIIAELFANSREREVEYCNRLGVNYIVREVNQWQGSFSASGYRKHLLHTVRNGRAAGPLEVYFDQTHDNRTYFNLDRISDMLPLVGNIYASKVAAGSTLGFDEMYKKKFETYDRHLKYKTKEVESIITDEAINLPIVLSIQLTHGKLSLFQVWAVRSSRC